MSDINLFTAAKAKKSLGQHFLHDERVVQRIVDLLRVEEGDQVMEIGPGPVHSLQSCSEVRQLAQVTVGE